jgi:hypothetical protein
MGKRLPNSGFMKFNSETRKLRYSPDSVEGGHCKDDSCQQAFSSVALASAPFQLISNRLGLEGHSKSYQRERATCRCSRETASSRAKR